MEGQLRLSKTHKSSYKVFHFFILEETVWCESGSLFFDGISDFFLRIGIIVIYLHRNKCILTMKKVASIFVFTIFMLLVSCRQDFNLQAEYKVVPVVYGLLDANADTNFIKITRSFYVLNDDATQVAMNPDSSDYRGKLDVRLTEFCNGDSVRQIILDTITIGNKQPGNFYAPKQKLYYTTERLRKNKKDEKYQYKLTIVLPDRTLVSTTDMVGSNGFRVKSLAVNYSLEYFGVNRPLEFYPAPNAISYEVRMTFTFKEQRHPGGDSIPRTMDWKLATYSNFYLASCMVDNYYRVTYRPERFYEQLVDFLGADTAVAGLKRFIGDYPVEIIVSAAGEELTRYLEWSSVGNYGTMGGNDFTLIDGGTGVFSSRMTTRSRVRLAGTTVPELMAHRNWGFKFTGGD